MAKYVQQSQVTGESGVIKFREYCNRHKPFIIFREIKEHDYGVDGEVELVKFEKDRQVASGQVIKVQLKSTAKDSSYIRNENSDGFTFYASKDDFEYWTAHNLGVVLVIYNAQHDRLFARKITREDYAYHLKHSKSNSFPIQFSYKDNELFIGEGLFFDKINVAYFKPRVDNDIEEKLLTNIQFFSSYPKKMFIYETDFGNKKSVFEKIESGVTVAPFVLYNKYIYCFSPLATNNKVFRDKILKDGANVGKTVSFDDIFDDKSLLNHYVELINLYLKDFFTRDRKLWLDRKQRHNYFFPKQTESDELKINYKTRKRGTMGERLVVNYYQYGKDSFFRHLGFTYQIDFIDKVPVFILNYKYHFTINGAISLSPLKITSYTNKLVAREYNDHVINHLHFWYEFLSGGSFMIDVANNDDFKIRIKPPEELTANFGIYKPKNIVVTKPKNIAGEDSQTKLF